MYANCLEVLTIYKYLLWLYLGAIITKIKLSSTDHVPALGINPGKMAILHAVFTFLVFLKNHRTVWSQRRTTLENTLIKAYSYQISWR